ncbi:hypothetical protein Poly51_48670 [Rubripirellula tenax]|uniref:HEAT repeat protein n=1 Tax=Rubripirellula tenax TaxID=2528015 RepID=A0A5C6EGK5_9BACT|nr:hypothetical protein [Rubripirellula tenax]TWU48963.1 hypothetical protein Poly51_48670 [Rubripirellula tenax]
MDEPYFDTISKTGSRRLYRYWTERAKCSRKDRLALATACDAFEFLFDSAILDPKRLDVIAAAASHHRKTVWETGTLMLSQLAQEHSVARDYLLQLASSRNGDLRLRSFAYLTDAFPRDFCHNLVLSRINDVSERIAHAACWTATMLNLTELSPAIRARAASTKHAIRLHEMHMLADLLDQQFHEYYNKLGYSLVLAFPDQFPTAVIWPGGIKEGEIAKLGLEAIMSRVRNSGSLLDPRRRAWKWGR